MDVAAAGGLVLWGAPEEARMSDGRIGNRFLAERGSLLVGLSVLLAAFALHERNGEIAVFCAIAFPLGLWLAYRHLALRRPAVKLGWIGVYSAVVVVALAVAALSDTGVVVYGAAIAAVFGAPFVAGRVAREEVPDWETR
jgi:hypothetical protein